MKTIVGVLLIGLGISLACRPGPALAGPPDDTAVNEELAKLQGRWQVVEVEENGERTSTDKLREGDVTVEIKGDQHTLSYGGQSQTVSVKIDPTTEPRRYDLIDPPDSTGKVKIPLGIYKLDGDTWTFCQDKSGKGRPTKFSGNAGPGVVLVVMKRVKKSAGVATDLQRLRGTWTIESAEVGGEKADQFVGGKMVFTESEHSIRAPGVPEENWPRGEHRLDPSRSPKHFDIDPKTGPNIGKTHLGIYEIDGDRCRICFADPPTDERPTEFVSKEGKRLLLFVLKREK